MAKTLTVNITPIFKKESRKRKKNKKKIHFLAFFQKKQFHSPKKRFPFLKMPANESTKKTLSRVYTLVSVKSNLI